MGINTNKAANKPRGCKPLETLYFTDEKNKEVIMFITDRKGRTHMVLFDLDLLDVVKAHRWSPTQTGTNCKDREDRVPYIYSFQSKMYLHHLVAGKPLGGLQIDHINRIPTDNRRENLRVVDSRTNILNRTLKRKATTGLDTATVALSA